MRQVYLPVFVLDVFDFRGQVADMQFILLFFGVIGEWVCFHNPGVKAWFANIQAICLPTRTNGGLFVVEARFAGL